MKRMVMNRRGWAVLAILTLALSVPALAQVEITFEGYAAYTPAPDMVGAMLTVYGVANPAVSAPTPFPADFDNYQYTVAVTGMLVTSYTYDGADLTKSYVFQGGTIDIYEDAKVGGTAGDFANPSTFTDGTLLLEAAVDDGWEMLLNATMGFGVFAGAGIGTCDMIGGSYLPLLEAMQYPLDDWTFAGTGISEPWPPFFTVPAGYDHVFGVKITFPYNPTPNDDTSWSRVKTLFR